MIQILLALFMAMQGAAPVTSENVITVENETLTGISLPSHGRLCEDVDVKSGPRVDAPTLYTLQAGEVVPLREQPRIEPRDWVMIYPHEWIPLSVLCE